MYLIAMLSTIKSVVRQAFYRSSLFRTFIGFLSVVSGRTTGIGMSHLLSYRENDAIGPLQRDEALALFGIVKTLRPKIIVEFGFFHGHSAFNFLSALSQDARLFSYDIDNDSCRRARLEFAFDKRFTFLAKSQTDFEAADIGDQKIDFLFFDAAHELILNQETFRRIAPHLGAEGMIAIHDTGLWNRIHFQKIHHEFVDKMPGEWVSDQLYAHQPGERAFIDWIESIYPEFGAIHFHSTQTLRHGFSLLQRRRTLMQRPD
jgi:predicted O-methyltransferase YrrM